MRHASEDAALHTGSQPEETPKLDPIAPTSATPTPMAPTPPVKEEKIAETAKMVNIGSNKSDQSDQPNPISKFWNWATQLF
jgi:cell division protein FtsA